MYIYQNIDCVKRARRAYAYLTSQMGKSVEQFSLCASRIHHELASYPMKHSSASTFIVKSCRKYGSCSPSGRIFPLNDYEKFTSLWGMLTFVYSEYDFMLHYNT